MFHLQVAYFIYFSTIRNSTLVTKQFYCAVRLNNFQLFGWQKWPTSATRTITPLPVPFFLSFSPFFLGLFGGNKPRAHVFFSIFFFAIFFSFTFQNRKRENNFRERDEKKEKLKVKMDETVDSSIEPKPENSDELQVR